MQLGAPRPASVVCSIALGLLSGLLRGQPAGYVDSKVCAACHQSIWETYQRTGMGRSFYRPRAANQIEDYTKIYFHQPSAAYYAMVQRDGKYFQRQYQIDYDGKQTNISEAEIDFIVGSGNHSRTYLHRTARNTLDRK